MTFPSLRRRARLGWFLLGMLAADAGANYPAPYHFTVLAGESSVGHANGTGSAARFWSPRAIVVTAAGNLLVADTANHLIRQVTPAGQVSTYAGKAGISDGVYDTDSVASFSNLDALAIDPAGNVYVFDSWAVRKVAPEGSVTTLAGGNYYGNEDGTGTNARFDGVGGMVADAAGNIFLTANGAVRKITPAGVVTTFAGQSGVYGNVDGTGSDARFLTLEGICLDPAGNLYVSDRGNHNIRKITPAGVVTTFAGAATTSNFGGTADGPAADAQFYFPWGITADAAGNLFVADTFTVRKITPAGVVTTLAGAPGTPGDGDGVGGAARFSYANGLATDAAGNVYVGDIYTNTVRKITPAGVVTTLAGLPPSQAIGSADGMGSAARFSDTFGGVAIASSGNTYVADTGNQTIRKITPAGMVTTLAGQAGMTGSADGTGSAARFNTPWGLAVDRDENVYVADERNYTVRKITPAGVVTTFAGQAGLADSLDGPGNAARFNNPHGIAVDAAGNVYVADTIYLFNFTAYQEVTRKITPAGVVTTVASIPVPNAYINDLGNAIALDPAGSICRFYRGSLARIAPDGTRTTVAGDANERGFADGSATAARFIDPRGLTIDGTGNTFITDAATIRKVTPDGTVATVAGLPLAYGYATGTGTEARFNVPWWIAADARGNVVVPNGSIIYRGQPAGPPVITAQPQNLSVAAGASVQFSVTTDATPAPTYQWYAGGQPVTDATASTLTFANARIADAGDYTVAVTNSLGSVTSNKATLTVSAGPTTPPPTTTPAAPAQSGGGGAPSAWFLASLTALGLARRLTRRPC